MRPFTYIHNQNVPCGSSPSKVLCPTFRAEILRFPVIASLTFNFCESPYLISPFPIDHCSFSFTRFVNRRLGALFISLYVASEVTDLWPFNWIIKVEFICGFLAPHGLEFYLARQTILIWLTLWAFDRDDVCLKNSEWNPSQHLSTTGFTVLIRTRTKQKQNQALITVWSWAIDVGQNDRQSLTH